MSLTARIALSPSRAVAIAERVVPLAGLAVAAAAIATRFPGSAVWTLAAALLVATAFLTRALVAASRPSIVLLVSDRPEVEVVGPPEVDGAWRLAESTVAWPGFAMLALEREDRRGALRYPVTASGLAARDRRAFARFVTWSMRAGLESRRSVP